MQPIETRHHADGTTFADVDASAAPSARVNYLDDVQGKAESALSFDLKFADAVMGVISIAHRAAGAAAITRVEADIWERDLRERAARGRFMMSFLGFFVVGRVPNPVEVNS